MVRSTVEMPPTAVVDEAAVQNLIDGVADRHGLRCEVCDPLGEGRVYLSQGWRDGPSTLVVNFDGENRALFFATTGFERDGRRGVLALAADIRTGMDERFPGITTTTFEDTHDSRPVQATVFEIDVSSGDVLAVESAEQAKRTLSSIVEAVVRTHGLRTDPTSLVYYAGRRVGVSAYERDFVLVPVYEDNATLRVRVTSSTTRFDELQRAVTEDLDQRLNVAFAAGSVTRR